MIKMKKESYLKIKFTSTIEKDSGDYIYKNTVKAKEFDCVLVPTAFGVSLGYVTEVMNLTEEEALGNSRFDRVKETLELVKKVKYFDEIICKEKAKALKKAMKDRMKKLEEISIIEMYAEKDPELKSMLAKFKELGGEENC